MNAIECDPGPAITIDLVYEFIVASANGKGRRRASPMLVYADMVTSHLINRYVTGEWRIVGECVAVLVAHGLVTIEHGPEQNSYDASPTSMIQVADWRRIQPRRTPIPDKIRQQVYERDGRACVQCGATDNLTLDHIIAWSRGGPDTADNLQAMCGPCNSRKGNRENA